MKVNNEEVPKKLMDNFNPEPRIRDVAFAVVCNVFAKDQNKSVNPPSMN
jgi:hypothetical protein